MKVCSNTVELDKMAASQLSDYGNGKDGGPPSGTDYASRVQHCRSMVRSSGFFIPDKLSSLKNLSGEEVRPETTQLIAMAKIARRQYLKNILSEKNFIHAENPDCSRYRDILNNK